jgi:hypothetical protein
MKEFDVGGGEGVSSVSFSAGGGGGAIPKATEFLSRVGGRAFPSQGQGTTNFGMTLRDYFAAKAMQGFMSRTLMPGFDEDLISERSYAIADAMLAAREVAQ